MKDANQLNEKTARRDFLGNAVLGAAVAGGVLGLTGAKAQADVDVSQHAKLVGLYPQGAPSSDSGYSPGIMARGSQIVYTAGQGPKDYDADMETQIRQTMDRIGLILKEAGASWNNVVMLRAYFVHLARDLPVYRKVRKDYLVKPYPASTAVGTPELAIPGLEIEIEATAVI